MDYSQSIVSSPQTEYFRNRGYTSVRFITNDKFEVPLAILVSAIDQALSDNLPNRLNFIANLLKSLIRKVDPAVSANMLDFCTWISEGKLKTQELYKNQRLGIAEPVVKLFARDLIRYLGLQKCDYESEQTIWTIIKKLSVNLKIYSISKGKVSKQEFFVDGPQVCMLRVVKSSTIEYFYLLPKSLNLKFSSLTLERDHEIPDEFEHTQTLVEDHFACKNCKVKSEELITKAVCGCKFCVICNPIEAVCRECSLNEQICRIEGNASKRFKREFDPNCKLLCVCRNCYAKNRLDCCPFCIIQNPNQPLEDKAAAVLQCSNCSESENLIPGACEGNCILCMECLISCVDDGFCPCGEAFSLSALEAIES